MYPSQQPGHPSMGQQYPSGQQGAGDEQDAEGEQDYGNG